MLPLLFSCCFVFSGFLSVNAFAVDVSPDGSNNWFLLPFNNFRTGFTNEPVTGTFDSVSGNYSSEFTSDVEGNTFVLSCGYDSGVFPTLEAGKDYLFYFTFSGWTDNLEFNIPRAYLRPVQNTSANQILLNVTQFFKGYLNNTLTLTAFFECSPTTDFVLSTSSGCYIEVEPNIFVDGRADWVMYVLDVTNKSEKDVDSIITAINNQTGAIQGSIGQASDDIQQSIEDQYSGDPEEEFSVDDVITQHNEKMGVLSFGSDVMLQFLDMFQSANVGTAELTLPGFNITVEDVEYSVWPDYSFNFEQLNEWVPVLMSVIRMMLPAFVWLMVLRYCVNVFEKNFLSNGG